MTVLSELQPKEVFRFFEEICAIPHGTYDTKRISDYCVKFAEERKLEVLQDEVNNVIIRKPGTAGYEESEPVILQGHLDMVCEKTPESAHDFATQGLDLYVEDGFVKARNTTLGGDDGIAVAMTLAILDSSDIAHPPIEAVFTVDEEIGMGGAMDIDLSTLKGTMLINIDSEDEGVLTVGCAGGFTMETKIPVERTGKTGTLAEIKVHGLTGGHSGIEIYKQRGNAHKMMARLLNVIYNTIEMDFIEINGGSKDNVIAMESVAEIMINSADSAKVKAIASEMLSDWNEEFMGDEPGLMVDVSVTEDVSADVCTKNSTERVVRYLLLVPNGVQGYSRKLEGLVETSLNTGVLSTASDHVRARHNVRSSVESKKQEIREQLEVLASVTGGTGTVCDVYPAWMYKEHSKLRDIMVETYRELYKEEPEVTTIHAGLECGLFLGKRADLDCVSFGPNLSDVHSFKEKLDIASTERSYTYLKEILAKCK